MFSFLALWTTGLVSLIFTWKVEVIDIPITKVLLLKVNV